MLSVVARTVLTGLGFTALIVQPSSGREPPLPDSVRRGVFAETTLAANRYTVAFDAGILRPRVTAELVAVGGRLFMAGWGADMHRRGWANYVYDLEVAELSGSPARFRPDTASARWQLADTTSRQVRVAYRVDLSFAGEVWPYGNEQAGSLQGSDLFVVTKALFISSDNPGPRLIEFVLPAGWHLAAPWPRASARPDVYIAGDDNALLNNSLVVGPTPPVEIAAGDFTFMLANLGATAADRALVADALTRVVREYVRIFPRTPPTRYVLTLFSATERDAEAYQASAAFTEVERLDDVNRIQWAQTVAHELFHSWNGAALRPEPYADLQWFSEGVTDYYATRTLARTRVIDERLFIRKMERTIALYLYFKAAPAFNGVTLKAAGARKGTHRLGVYEGGWVAALCLDVTIRKQTRGERTLDDVLRALYEEFGLQNRAYTEADLRRVLGNIAGRDANGFLDMYITGDDVMPVNDCLSEAGYRGFGAAYQAEYYVEPIRSSPYRAWLFPR